MAADSAGLLAYRRRGRSIQVLLGHPGGPFWARRDAGAWSIPKGEPEPGEELLPAARREFEEETGTRPEGDFLALGSVRQRAGKRVHAWAWEAELDAAGCRSNTVELEWPRGSGRRITIPEVDRFEWFDSATAREKINPAQAELIDRLEERLA